jgi:hypothetical protein
MKWSKLQANIEARFAPALGKRLRLHQARYRNTREEAGRIWFEVDGKEVASFATYPAYQRRVELTGELMDVNNSWGTSAAFHQADKDAQELLRKRGEQSDYAAEAELESFLSLSIDDALDSPSPLLRALAIADKRVGKRRLRMLAIGDREHALVRTVYTLRCAVERVHAGSPAA